MTDHLARHQEQLDDGSELLTAGIIERARRVVMQAEYLAPRYSVIVANPPYMGNGSMGALLADFAKSLYPSTKTDLFSMFIERALTLALRRGLVGMVTMHSWMFLKSYRALQGEGLAQHGPRRLCPSWDPGV